MTWQNFLFGEKFNQSFQKVVTGAGLRGCAGVYGKGVADKERFCYRTPRT